MSEPTALKQYITSGAGFEFDPGDVTSGTITDIGSGTVPGSAGVITIHYKKVGNLYFGFNAYTVLTGQVNMVLGPLIASVNPNSAEMDDVVDRVCALLGITEQARYVGFIYSQTPRVAAYYPPGPYWSQGNANETEFLIGILAV